MEISISNYDSTIERNANLAEEKTTDKEVSNDGKRSECEKDHDSLSSFKSVFAKLLSRESAITKLLLGYFSNILENRRKCGVARTETYEGFRIGHVSTSANETAADPKLRLELHGSLISDTSILKNAIKDGAANTFRE
ncbi:hypothetical protein HZH68_007582 [Vespula germanica]|uniref:Uncharacterized protein n=1 Tax=Vespula germanica TaxID=30212 RepID=A0A834NA30_VESGE|nr:hypothetical protein HZH68_007582 [Vespula germanica]